MSEPKPGVSYACDTKPANTSSFGSRYIIYLQLKLEQFEQYVHDAIRVPVQTINMKIRAPEVYINSEIKSNEHIMTD